MNLTTARRTLFLLAAMLSLGAVCGVQIGARIEGVTTAEEPCSLAVEEMLFEECVEGVAISLGVDLSRRLELRGNRELQVYHCSACEPKHYWRGSWCFTMCQSRRLTLTDEQAHPKGSKRLSRP
jgi:hypothetical protein